MNECVQNDAPAVLGVVEPVIRGLPTEHRRPRGNRVTKLARHDPSVQVGQWRRESQHEAELDDAVGSLRRVHDPVGVGQRERDRLLAEHVLSGLQCSKGLISV